MADVTAGNTNADRGKGHDDDDNMSLEERMAWLRERGVLVETAEERKRQQVAVAIRQADALLKEIFYVRVPSDSSQPLEELTFQPDPSWPGDALLRHLQPFFTKKSNESVDVELLKQHGVSTLAGSADVPTVADSTLQQVAAEANVETFSLVHAIPSNKFTGINMYLDEVGMLKRLPLNKRASDIAARAGFNPAPVFYGDVFLSRIEQRPKFKNLSFQLGIDTADDAQWLRAAVTENLEYQKELNAATGQGGVQQIGVAGSDGRVKEEEGYSWTQTEAELEIVVRLPADATSTKVSVKFRSHLLEIIYQAEPRVHLPLFERIDVDACTWTMEPDKGEKKLVVTMEKLEEAFWPRIRD